MKVFSDEILTSTRERLHRFEFYLGDEKNPSDLTYKKIGVSLYLGNDYSKEPPTVETDLQRLEDMAITLRHMIDNERKKLGSFVGRW